MTGEKELTDKQKAFALAYATHFEAKKAALVAGYSESMASKGTSQLLGNPRVQKEIAKNLEVYGNKHEVLKKRLLNQLVNIAFSDINDFASVGPDGVSVKEWSEMPRNLRMLVSEVKETRGKDTVTVQFKLVDKLRAMEMIGKHLGMFVDKVEHEVIKPTYIESYDGRRVIELGGERVKLGDGDE